jgi:hypothetical protein
LARRAGCFCRKQRSAAAASDVVDASFAERAGVEKPTPAGA